MTRNVQFATNERVVHRQSDYTLTEEEIRSLWFSKSEFKEIRMGVKEAARQMAAAGYTKDKIECTRGLRTKHMAIVRSNRVMLVRMAVLGEQSIQQHDEEDEEDKVERLAETAMKFSRTSRHDALQQGLQDEKEAATVLLPVEEPKHDARPVQSAKTKTLTKLRGRLHRLQSLRKSLVAGKDVERTGTTASNVSDSNVNS